MRIRNNQNRRGLTLLFVVSMIVLFLLMGSTFMIISNDYFKSARRRGQAKIYAVDRTALVHRSFFNIVRGPDLLDTNSPLRGHDLLSDQYGYGFKATVDVAEPIDPTRLQLVRLELTGIRDILADAAWGDAIKKWEADTTTPKPPKPPKPDDLDANSLPGLNVPGYFGGQVLSFVDGRAKGVSARIIDYTVTEDAPGSIKRSFVIVPERTPNGTNTPFDNLDPITGNPVAEIATLVSSTVIINGRPFSGLGAGTKNAFAANPFEENPAEAFRPNHARYDSGAPWTDSFFTQYATIRNAVNEPYDAYDHDNVPLAQNNLASPAASFNPVQLAALNGGEDENRYSFRPVYEYAAGAPKPNNTANKEFPNVGPETNPHPMPARPLDVDNDFDGVLDSVWIDIGYSIITAPDGRQFKPLVAPLIVDLDSRLNVNVHGTLADAQARAAGIAGGFMTNEELLGPDSITPADPFFMARGLGWGPAEVSLAPLLADYRPLLIGTPVPDATYPFNSTFPDIPGRNGVDRFPGNSFFDDPAKWRFLDHPNFGTVGGSFQSRPMDIQGRFATGFPRAYETHTIPDPLNAGSTIDVDVPYGMPIVDIANSEWPPAGPLSNSDVANPYPGIGYEIYNSPYEISLLKNTHRSDDDLFTPDELEAVLRNFDVDSQLLSSRLLDFGIPTSSRHLVTTDSYEVPALPPTLFQNGATVNQTIPERLYGILSANGFTQNDAFAAMRGGTPTNVVHSLLAPEVMRGLPMNINRIFGDGADNDGDGITDEHWNSADPDENEQELETYPLNATVGLDHNNDGAIEVQDRFARQIFARHLFVLTWLVAGGTGNDPDPPDMDGDGMIIDRDYEIRLLAQWCINVVDFRDADSICTPFRYDKNPWDGWEFEPYIEAGDPDAYDDGPSDPVGIVWGLERPELLITEALATHERRYEDDGSGSGTYESKLVPKASVFVEVYNPWATTGVTEKAPAEFYGAGGVDLARHTNALIGGAVEDPVWRLAFTKERNDRATDTDARRVYFREPPTSVEAETANFYHPPTGIAINTIVPNGYAVIGSSGIEYVNNRYRTTFGRRTDLGPPTPPPADLKLDETRSITLIPGTGVEGVDGTDGNNMSTEARSCVAIPIGLKGTGASEEERSLGLTDPDAGYPASIDIDPNSDTDPSDGDGKQFLVPQVPVADDQTEFPEIFNDGLSYGARYVQLQRLANPEVPYDAATNPYVTIDTAPVDLLSFNGLADTSDDVTTDGDMDLDSHERGEYSGVVSAPPIDPASTASDGTLWNREHSTTPATMENDRFLWPEEDVRRDYVDVPPLTTDLHFLSQEFDESFGTTNDTYRGYDANVETKPFTWFTWNNRPYVSQYELVNVPMYRAKNVLNTFSTDANQLVPFNDSTLKRIFNFLEVPPRFVNMEVGFVANVFNSEIPSETYASVFNPPHNYVSRYRYPGKININTMTTDQALIWNVGMMDKWGVNFARLENVRGASFDDPIRPDGTASVDLPRAIDNPSIKYTDPEGIQRFDGSLLRSSSRANFLRSSNLPHEDTTRNYWFANSSVTKLGNIATNRSSVYAIWITVGYFEVDNEGRLGAEIGSDTGEITRNRGFYIFDRSIPMAFEPGKNHNVERGILVQSMIE